MNTPIITAAAAAVTLLAATARAQYSIPWSTIDGGGGASTGGSFSLTGTIGQHDAAAQSGGTFVLGGGFWFTPPLAALCYPNCDTSTGTPVLTPNDFQCFLDKFAANDPYANCDHSSGVPLLTANDFQCFLNAYAAGCP